MVGLQVVKVGGSLCEPTLLPDLIDWLDAAWHAGPLLVVCGGGRYADTVRIEQQRLGLSDLTAHRQALLCMEQTAWALQQAWQQRHQRAPVVRSDLAPDTLWTPRALLPDHLQVAADWQMTSDSLAAWVAGQAGACALTVLKALDCGELQAGAHAGQLADWSAQGWVDARFASHARPAQMSVRLLGQRAWRTTAVTAAT